MTGRYLLLPEKYDDYQVVIRSFNNSDVELEVSDMLISDSEKKIIFEYA